MPQVRVVPNRKVQEREIAGFPCVAAKEVNARCNDQPTEESQAGCADSASLQAASKAAWTDKPKVKLDKSARFGESLQPGTVMWECQGECARHNRPSPCGALERAQGDVVKVCFHRCHASRPLSCKKRPRGRIGRKMRTMRTMRKIVQQSSFL